MVSVQAYMLMSVFHCFCALAIVFPELPGLSCRALWALFTCSVTSAVSYLVKMKSQVFMIIHWCNAVLLALHTDEWASAILTVARDLLNHSGASHTVQLTSQAFYNASVVTKGVTSVLLALIVLILAYKGISSFRKVRRHRT